MPKENERAAKQKKAYTQKKLLTKSTIKTGGAVDTRLDARIEKSQAEREQKINEALIYLNKPEILSVLDILLKDKATGENIKWATDTYGEYKIYPHREMVKTDLLRLKTIITPRVNKPKKVQEKRTKKHAEVFTPTWLCNMMNNFIDDDWFGVENVFNTASGHEWTNKEIIEFPQGKDWKKYIQSRRLEITCGEAPYIVSRYDAATGEVFDISRRIGLLDRKMKVVNQFVADREQWLVRAKAAYNSVYGYEWQGDNLLTARINLMLTFDEYYFAKWGENPAEKDRKAIANIITWNFFQMNGLTYTVPDTQPTAAANTARAQISMFGDEPVDIQGDGAVKCVTRDARGWKAHPSERFFLEDIAKGKRENMKFDYVIGNPPYQGENHQQLYPDFYISGQDIGDCVEMIFPTGWQEPKNANNLKKLNNPKIKEDIQIVFIDNRQNVFEGVSGAEWTNIILWKKGFDNGLNGLQKIFTNGDNEIYQRLAWEKDNLVKPKEIMDLAELVKEKGDFTPLSKITSVRKPYGLSTDVIKDYEKYNLQPLYRSKQSENDIKVYAKSGLVLYVPFDYKFPKKTHKFEKYKVLIPYAWGNMSEKSGLGGAFSDIIVASPFEACTETYLESGEFDNEETAIYHAKYLLTKFARALLYVNKYSQHSTTSWGAIPVQDYSENWWKKTISEIDDELFEKYDVPINIRDFIISNFQTKNESNIINYKEMA